MIELPTIEYDKHPAFHGFQDIEHAYDEEIERLSNEIDAAYSEIKSSHGMDATQLRSFFDVEIVARLDRMCGMLELSGHISQPFMRYVGNSIQKAKEFLYAQLEFHLWKKSAPHIRIEETTQRRLEEMAKDGHFAFSPDQGLAQKVWEVTGYERSCLVDRAKNGFGGRCAIPLHPQSAASRLIRRKLKTSGALDLASAYLGCEMEWKYCALEFSHESQRWYRDCYADAGLPTSKTVYMHLDADTEMVKGMLYLQDVSEEQGPFRYIRGSSNWERSPCTLAIHKGFDSVENEVFEMEPSRLDYKLGYYRPRFKLPEYRKHLMTLPALFRGTTHFGDDVVDASPLSSSLLSAGTILVFDGSSGIHRGGQVVRGERWAVQIAMKAVRKPKTSFQSAVETVTQNVRYCAHLAKRWFKGVAR
jgi:hypothetical protein